jgi:hypothetical protein
MTGTSTPAPLFVDPSVAYHTHRRIAGRNVQEVRHTAGALAEDAMAHLTREGRLAVQIEVILRVAPQ